MVHEMEESVDESINPSPPTLCSPISTVNYNYLSCSKFVKPWMKDDITVGNNREIVQHLLIYLVETSVLCYFGI